MKQIIKKVKSDRNILSIDLPDKFVNKKLQVIIQVDEGGIEKSLKTDKIRIDTKKWKYKREEIYD